jgi:hypothetical protein
MRLPPPQPRMHVVGIWSSSMASSALRSLSHGSATHQMRYRFTTSFCAPPKRLPFNELGEEQVIGTL